MRMDLLLSLFNEFNLFGSELVEFVLNLVKFLLLVHEG
jgi:hypothetical protein